ncbi:MAG: hypothetical protein ACPG52_12210 [Cognaticolwellia sp.]
MLLIITLVSMVLCYVIAKRRNANAVFWLLAAFLAGPLAIPFVFFAKPTANSQ